MRIKFDKQLVYVEAMCLYAEGSTGSEKQCKKYDQVFLVCVVL